MRRRAAIASGLTVAALLLALLFLLATRGPGRTPDTWQTALDAYLIHRRETAGQTLKLAASVQATAPDLFGSAMRTISHGRGVFYQVDAMYLQATPTPGVYGLSPKLSRKPVPYPPRELVCAVLEAEAANVATPRLVFVALHQDLYNAAWIVHEVDVLPLDSDTKGYLAALGCASVLEQD